LFVDSRNWLAAGFWISILAVFATVCLPANAAEPKRILLLHSFGRDFSPWNEYAKQIRVELRQQVAGPIDIFEVSLATARFAGENLEEPFAEYLRSLFENRKLDLAVTVGAPAASFFHKHRSKISPATPVVFVGLEQRRLPQPLAPNETAVVSVLDFARSLEKILSILPETKNVAVVVGNSPLEQGWGKCVTHSSLLATASHSHGSMNCHSKTCLCAARRFHRSPLSFLLSCPSMPQA
jgi:hypothetical protein